MKLESKNNRKTVLLLTVILMIAVSFIVSSSLLISEVNQIQKEVKSTVILIGTINKVEENIMDLQYSLNDSNHISSSKLDSIKRLINSYKELSELKELIPDNKKLNFNNLNTVERSIVLQKLFSLEKLCRATIFEARLKLTKKSERLNTLWSYTYYTLIIACLLMIILVLIVLYVAQTRKKLGEERSKNKFLFDNSINCIMTANNEGEITEFNKAAELLFGYKKSEVKNVTIKSLYKNEEDILKVENALKTNGVFVGEIVNKRKDGSFFVSYLSANLIYGPNGEVIGSMGISQDITSQKEREAEFQNIINNAQDIIYTIDTSGNFSFVNSSGSSVMGYNNKELIGKNFTELVNPEEVEKITKFYINQLKNKVERSYLEFRGITKEKQVVWLGQNVTTLFSPSDPETVIGFQGVVRNINKRKEAEEKLRKSEESFRIIVNTINDLFYLFDFRTDRFEYISPNTKEVLGVDSEFFYSGKSYFEEFVHKNDLKVAMKAEAQLLRGEPYNIEYRIITEGKTRWIHDRAFPIKDKNGKIVSYSGVSRDITDVKTANLIIEQQNEEISQSLSYAKNIQESILLTTEEIHQIYKDSFVFFNPRDALSGDFYIIEKFNAHELGNLTIFAVGDCTGHGVPGGMLSFLCSSLIREAFADIEVNSTSEILGFVREKLIHLFRSNREKHIHDGMDITLCALNEEGNTLYFSGANLPLTIIRNGEVFEIKGDRQHVGYNRRKEDFTTQIIDIQQGDMVYLFSDGYQDQFGGKHGKKYLKKRLKNLLISIHNKPLEEQYDTLKLEFHNWKGDIHQVDDVTILGIRI